MSGKKHPNKDIRKALKSAKKLGWELLVSKGHPFGILICGQGCRMSIWSTPRNPENHAKRINKFVSSCPHKKEEE